MRTYKVLTLAVLTGLSVGLGSAEAGCCSASPQNQIPPTDAKDVAKEPAGADAAVVPASAAPEVSGSEDPLIQALRKQEAANGTSVMTDAEKAKAARKAMYDEIAVQKALAKEEAQKRKTPQNPIQPLESTSTAADDAVVSAPAPLSDSDPLIVALRKKEKELDEQHGFFAVGPVPAPLADSDPLIVALRQKERELDAQPRLLAVGPTPAPLEDSDPLIVALRQKERELDGLPGLLAVNAAPAPLADSHPLIVALRKKEQELDAQPQPAVALAKEIVASAPLQGIEPAIQPITIPVDFQLIKALRQAEAEAELARENLPDSAAIAQAAMKAEQQRVNDEAASAKSQKELAEIARKTQEQLTLAQQAKEEAAKAREEAAKAKEEAAQAREQARIAKEAQERLNAANNPAPKVVTAPVVNVTQEAPKKVVVKETKKVSSPVTPITKEQKLADLLRRYKADEITPHQYHIERAKILSEL